MGVKRSEETRRTKECPGNGWVRDKKVIVRERLNLHQPCEENTYEHNPSVLQ